MTWLYPSFLWALLALLIPIIVHLFNFRKYKRIEFTNLRFLKQIQQQTKTGSQLKKYLILASRLLALAFLVFAFAQPVKLHHQQKLNQSGQLINIIFDNSYSMNNNGPEGLLLEAAKNRARAIINASKNNDEFQIITANLNTSLMRTCSKQTAIENIDKIRINTGGRPLTQLLQIQERISKKAQAEKRLFLISDFQKNNLPESNLQLDSEYHQTWIRIPSENAQNISIDTCYLNSPVLQVGETISITTQVSNYSSNEIQGLTVNLLVDNQSKGLATFNIKPYSSEKQTINFVIETGGEHTCVIQHQGDQMGFDDKLYFSLNFKNEYHILNIYDKKEQYINSVFNQTKGFLYKGFSAGNVQYTEFGNASLICLEGNNNVSNGMAVELKNYVQKGGNLFIFPQANLPFGGLQPIIANIGFSMSEQPVILNGKVISFDKEHPVFQNLFDKIPKNPDLPLVARYHKLDANAGLPLMKLNNGDPFIVAIKIGKGQLFVCGSPLNMEYTNFQNHAFFVPLLLKAAMRSQYESTLYFQCGQTENIPTGLPFSSEKNIALKRIGITFIPEVINMNGELILNTNGEIEEAGWYSLVHNNIDSGSMNLSFNHNRKESDTRTLSDSELEKIASENGADLFTGSSEKLSIEFSNAIKGTPLWKWCIIFVLLFLMIEILLIRFLHFDQKLKSV